MTFQHMECCQGGVHIGHCHVQFAKIKQEAPIYNTIRKCLGLIIIVVFSHETVHSSRVEMLSLREEQCVDILHNTYLNTWSGKWSMICLKSHKYLRFKLMVSLRTSITGQSIVYFGSFHIENTNFSGTTWTLCILKNFCENIINIVIDVSDKNQA